MKIHQNGIQPFLGVFLALSLLVMNAAPALAQLGNVASPPVVETPPAPPAEVTQPSVEITPPPVQPIIQVVTPPADTTAPVISGVASLSLGITDATIVWTTDELAVSTLAYGTTVSYGSQATLGASALLAHTAILTGLTANTTYHYCIHATDLAGNTANSCGHSFATAAEPIVADTTPPDVTLIIEGTITPTQATISFTTSEVGSARIEYGTTAGYGQTSTLNVNLALTHSVTLSNLTPNTEYHYRIISSDEVGNETITSDETFMTEAVSASVVVVHTDTVAPVVSGAGSVTLGITDATLAWITNELSISTLEYGTTQSYGSHTTLGATAGLAHTATLTGLTAGTTYYYCIHATDLAGNVTNSCPHSFTTEPAAVTPPVVVPATDTTAPQISLITAAPITASDATISWTTNELATSEIQYGTTASYGSTTHFGGAAALTHSATLSVLSSNTTYHYRLVSTDASGNIGYSADETLTTSVLPQAEAQVQTNTLSEPQTQTQAQTLLISGIEIGSIGTSTVTILWNTNLLSDSQVEYGDSDKLGSLTTLDSALATSHSVTIAGLTSNTNYIFRVKSKPLAATVATVSGNDEFNTLNHSTPVVAGPNVSLVSFSEVTSTGTTISWTTDKAATSHVEYGISTSYGAVSALSSGMVTSHLISLADLESGTTYHFRVKSTDEVSNITFSEDYTFTTAVPSSHGSTSQGGVESNSASVNLNASANAPAAIATLNIGGYDEHSAALVWHVASNTSDIAALYDIRYSTSPITESNFVSAAEAQLTPIYYGDLNPVNTERTYIVAGLNPKTTYYFAVKSKHENSNYSDISNVVTITTTAGVSVNNESISENTSGSIASGSGSSAAEEGSLSTHSAGRAEASHELGQSSRPLLGETMTGEQAGSSSGGGGGGLSVAREGSSVISSGYGRGSDGRALYSYVPTMVKAEPAENQIIFEWNNPGEANFVRTIIVQKEGSYPTSPTDGQTLYEGRGQTFTDTNVQNGKTYYYALYSYNHDKIYSGGIKVSLAPHAGNKEVKFNESGSITSLTPALHFVRVWKYGDKDIEIEHLQEVLFVDQDAYPEKYVTGYFGSLTQSALKRFQKKHGLPQTGMVDAATQKELNAISHSETKLDIPTDYVVFNTNLKYGDEGDVVENLQIFLINEGSYEEAIISGYFDNVTKKAVMKFQKKYAIRPVSGFVGPKTRHRMRELTGL